MRPIPSLAAILCLAFAIPTPAQSADDQPLLEVELAPLPAISAHFRQSIFSSLWNDPSMAPLRALLDEGLKDEKSAQFRQAMALLAAEQGIGLRVMKVFKGAEHPDAQVLGVADLGDQAPAAMALLKAAGCTALNLPGADEAVLSPAATKDGSDTVVVGRFGPLLRLAHGLEAPPAWRPETGGADLAMSCDLHALLLQLLAMDPDIAADPLLAHFADRFGRLSSSLTLVTAGVRSTATATVPTEGLIALDAGTLKQLPANCLEVAAVGVDGAGFFTTWSPPILALVKHALDKAGRKDDPLSAANAALAGLDLPPLNELVGALKGTCLFFSTPGTLLPSYSLVLPRTPTLDGIVAALLAKANLAMPPEGTAVPLPIPRMPILPQLLVTDRAVLLTTDPALASQWPSKGWSESVIGRQALARIGNHTVSLSSGDTAAELRMVSGAISMAMGQAPITAEQKQAVLSAILHLAATCSPDWSVGRVEDGALSTEGEGIGSISGMAAMGVVAALAVPAFMNHQAHRPGGAAAATLRSGILPAEVQFQAGDYVDGLDQGIGEYGYLSEMSGQVKVGPNATMSLQLLAPAFQGKDPVVEHFHYQIFLPSGAKTAQSDPFPNPRNQEDAATAAMRERYWVAYAWPDQGTTGDMYAINQAGNVYVAPFTGAAPAWNDLYGGGNAGWEGARPVWKPYRR